MSPKGALLLIAGKGKPDADDAEEKDDEGSTDAEMEKEALKDAVEAITHRTVPTAAVSIPIEPISMPSMIGVTRSPARYWAMT